MSLDFVYVLLCSWRGASLLPPMGEREWLPVERGANGLVDLQLKVGISLAFNGRDRTCVTGMSLLVTTLLKVGIYLAFNGQVHVQYSYFHMNLYEYVTAETPASVLPQTRM